MTVNNVDRSSEFLRCIEEQRQECGVVNEGDREFKYFEAVSFNVSTPEKNATVKAYNFYNLGDCRTDFGFKSGEPCFFMTINKVNTKRFEN